MAYGGNMFHGSNACSITPLGLTKQRSLEDIIASTWDPTKVGIGSDAASLKHTDIVFTGIDKVHNASLLASYYEFRDEIDWKTRTARYSYDTIQGFTQELAEFNENQRDFDLNEFYLFHGTNKKAVMNIVKKGFNPKKTNPNALYGQGVYFTDKFTKADQYADKKHQRKPPGTELTVLLCKVVLGNFLQCAKQDAKKWKSCPCFKYKHHYIGCQCKSRNKYDSVLGEGRRMLFREFVVYDGAQCYPEYIIKYRRIEEYSDSDESDDENEDPEESTDDDDEDSDVDDEDDESEESSADDDTGYRRENQGCSSRFR